MTDPGNQAHLGRGAEREASKRRPSLTPRSSLRLGATYPKRGLPSWLLFGEHRVLLRALRPDDRERLIAFFKTHTEETIASRYGYAIKEMSPERATQLVSIDQQWDAAIGCFEEDRGSEHLIAIGRCCRNASGDTAELAFVVSEKRRRLGIATALLRTLASLMTGRGVRRLTAEVNVCNCEMIGVLRKAGFKADTIPGTDILEMRMELFG